MAESFKERLKRHQSKVTQTYNWKVVTCLLAHFYPSRFGGHALTRQEQRRQTALLERMDANLAQLVTLFGGTPDETPIPERRLETPEEEVLDLDPTRLKNYMDAIGEIMKFHPMGGDKQNKPKITVPVRTESPKVIELERRARKLGLETP